MLELQELMRPSQEQLVQRLELAQPRRVLELLRACCKQPRQRQR